jgi:ABC-type nitrate/sulfonate/bicarbonate transport system substrate-binding protein
MLSNLRMQTTARLRRAAAAVLVASGLATAHAPAGAQQSVEPLSVIVFPGGFNWPIWVAQEKGYFARGGLQVNLTPTPSSAFQLANLIDGKFDIAHTAIDNVIAYMEGQGEAKFTGKPDLTVFMGGDNGFLALVTQPDVKSYNDLKGKTLSVDALTTGYAFVLLDLLKRNGLKPDDYKIERAGGVMGRWQALQEKKHAGTMLITPFDILAKDQGFNALQYAIDLYKNYQGLVGAARREWVAQNPKKVDAYIRGYLAGLDYLFEPKNKDEAIGILRKNLPNMSPQLAAQTYDSLVGPRGFSRTAELDIAGVRKVLELRSEYGQPKKALSDPARYYDLKLYEAARR